MSKIIDFIKRFRLTHNAPQKIFSVLLALVLWLIIIDYENPQMTKTFRNIPIRYLAAERLADDKLFAETPLDETVNITVQGRRNDVLALSEAELSAAVDMSNLSSGKVDLPIVVSSSSNLITILNSDKIAVRVVLDDIVELTRLVDHFAEGELAAPLEVLNKQITPRTIVISGPKKRIERVDKVIIPYSLVDVTQSVSFYDKAIILDVDGEIIEDLDVANDRFRVDVTVGKTVDLPIEYKYLPIQDENLRVVKKTESAAYATVRGSIELLKTLKQVATKPIELPAAAELYEAQVALDLVDELELRAPSAIKVTVDIDYWEEKQYNLTADAVQFANQSDELEYTVLDDINVPLNLASYRHVFAAEDYELPKIEVDLAGFGIGNHNVPYRVKLDKRIDSDQNQTLSGYLEVAITVPDEE
ncbi:MAG: hypothetical protein CSB19_01610 [Clostridiales bacterium]|nr:MAG: hypothetical protein CSB19_01610 [Clostridiales bacterium]